MDTEGAQTETTVAVPRVAIVLNRDLIFGSRIRSALAALGLEATFVPDSERFVTAITSSGPETAIGILDMNGPVEWNAVAAMLSGMADGPPTLAFGPHVDIENRRAAKTAGVTRIVSNGQFHGAMAELIDRYRRR